MVKQRRIDQPDVVFIFAGRNQCHRLSINPPQAPLCKPTPVAAFILTRPDSNCAKTPAFGPPFHGLEPAAISNAERLLRGFCGSAHNVELVYCIGRSEFECPG